MFRSAIERAGLDARLDCRPLDEPVYVDRDMWEKIVLNLLSNALKFTFEGGIAVSLLPHDDGRRAHGARHRRRHRCGGAAASSSASTASKGARGRTHEGSGIGLALVAELVKLHGGRVDVQSESARARRSRCGCRAAVHHLPAERIGARREPRVDVNGGHALRRGGTALDRRLRGRRGSTSTSPVALERQSRRRASCSRTTTPTCATTWAACSQERWDVEAVSDGAAALAAIGGNRPTSC